MLPLRRWTPFFSSQPLLSPPLFLAPLIVTIHSSATALVLSSQSSLPTLLSKTLLNNHPSTVLNEAETTSLLVALNSSSAWV